MRRTGRSRSVRTSGSPVSSASRRYASARGSNRDFDAVLGIVASAVRKRPWSTTRIARFVAGVVLYDGSAGIAFGDGLFVVPLRKLWEPA